MPKPTITQNGFRFNQVDEGSPVRAARARAIWPLKLHLGGATALAAQAERCNRPYRSTWAGQPPVPPSRLSRPVRPTGSAATSTLPAPEAPFLLFCGGLGAGKFIHKLKRKMHIRKGIALFNQMQIHTGTVGKVNVG